MISKLQIKLLNRVRTLLRALQHKSQAETGRDFERGKFSEACYQAEDAIFNVLNLDKVYLDGEESDEELHNPEGAAS